MPKKSIDDLFQKPTKEDLFAPGTMWGDIEQFQGREALFRTLASPHAPKGDLAAYIEFRGPYKGDNPHIMLAIFDALYDKDEGLSYGLKGIEKLNRDPKALLKLRHPEKLIEYITITSEDVSELSQLLDEFRDAIHHVEEKSRSFSYSNAKYSELQLSLEELAQQVIAIGTGVVNLAGHMTIDSYINASREGEKAREEASNKLFLLRNTYTSMAQAAQILGNEQLVLDYIQLHYETGAGYDIREISHDILEKFAFKLYGMDTVSKKGKVPKSMKYDRITSPLNRIRPLSTFDDIFRLKHFQQVKDLSKEPDEETLVEKQLATDKDFTLLGISMETPWEEANKTYRQLMKERYSAVYNSVSPHEQTKKVQEINDVFGRIREFYIQKALQQQQNT